MEVWKQMAETRTRSAKGEFVNEVDWTVTDVVGMKFWNMSKNEMIWKYEAIDEFLKVCKV